MKNFLIFSFTFTIFN